MTVTFRPAVRENLPLLLGVAGGTGSGKTYSSMQLATGIAGGQRFAVIDTENGRASHYADQFDFDVADLRAPFRPAAYTDAIAAADQAGYPVIVVDSTSHEWAGDGGCLDWHNELMGSDQRKNLSAWIQPKRDHKQMVTRLLQVRAHVILCFRAEEKVESIDDPERPGRQKIVKKASLVGLDGWIPIAEKNLPYELTASFLLTADKPGIPKPIKLEEQHRAYVPLDKPLTPDVGAKLAEWARGGAKPATSKAAKAELAELEEELLALAAGHPDKDKRAAVETALERKRGDVNYPAWLLAQVENARQADAERKAA